MLKITETKYSDLKNIQALWADGDVMKFVGFPEGLIETDEYMENWYKQIVSSRPSANHYSIYDDGIYCGETFYSIDPKNKAAAMDIKLFSHARGKGIASAALKFAIGEAFANGAEKAWVDPNPHNEKAIALYRCIGMIQKPLPPELYDDEYPDTIYFEIAKP
ncbi:MAG: GNAT family N-acetyltransferase [Clostridia bacterium]